MKGEKSVYQKHLGQESGHQVTWEGTHFSGAVKTWQKSSQFILSVSEPHSFKIGQLKVYYLHLGE